MVKRFNSFNKLNENTLYSTPVDKAEFIKDKGRVAHAFLFNFFGTLGMINATQPAQRQTLINFLKTDKQLRLDKIDDSNLDISLSVKLANDAGFFVNSTVVNEITRFLVKLKQGSITNVDSLIVGHWAASLKPDFVLSIKDPALRQAFTQFRSDGGKTIDVSRLAVEFKTRAIAVPDAGDFKVYSARFAGLVDTSPVQPTAVAVPVAPTPVTTPAAAPALSYYLRRKLAKQQAAAAAAAGTPAPAAPTPATTPAPTLSYYLRRKLAKQQAAAAAAGTPAVTTPAATPVAPTPAAPALSYYLRRKLAKQQAAATGATPAPVVPAVPKLSYYERQKLAKKQAADEAKAIADKAAAEAKAAAELKAKEEEENRKAAAANIKTIPREDLERMIAPMFGSSGLTTVYISPAYVKHMFNFDIVPDIYTNVNNILLGIPNNLEQFPLISKQLEEVSGHTITLPQFIEIGLSKPGISIYNYYNPIRLAIETSSELTPDMYKNLVDSKMSADSITAFLEKFDADSKSIPLMAEIVANNPAYLKKAMNQIKIVFTRMQYNNTYQPGHRSVVRFAIAIMKATGKPLEYFIREVGEMSSYSFAVFLKTFGLDQNKAIGGINASDELYIKAELKKLTLFGATYDSVKLEIMRYLNAPYEASWPLLKMLHDEFIPDLMANGWTNSKLSAFVAQDITTVWIKNMLVSLGVDVDDLLKAHPNDVASKAIKAITNGLHTITSQELAEVILSQRMAKSGHPSNIIEALGLIANTAKGDRDMNHDRAIRAMLEIAKTKPAEFNSQRMGETLFKYLPYATQDTTVAWLKLAEQSKLNMIMGPDLYKAIDRSLKSTYVDTLTGVMQDCIGTEVEDYVSDLIDNLPGQVINKMRGNLIGGNAVINEINRGEIKPFDKIDAARLKKIFLYNDINMASLVSGAVDRKKKSETYVQYFARAAKAVQSTSLIGEAKVKHDPKADAKAINRIMIQRDHAGKHGNVYPKIDKVYDASLEYPEFWDFRKRKPVEGPIVPAYHGTGGIAASMILRYGFKVIKDSDPSVVGRMLGNGIYFSNKIDKVSQYVSNGGYSKQEGQKGYVMELDTNLGTKGIDYRSAGLGGDSIRSPEWCVFDPKAQTRVIRVYEVTLVTKQTVDTYLKEGYNELRRFKQHLKEQVIQDMGKFTSFIFRDGMIPIIEKDTYAITFVDFEEALEKKLIDEDMFDTSAQGPVIVFRDTKDQIVIDERYASHMGGDDLQLYIQLFSGNMHRD